MQVFQGWGIDPGLVHTGVVGLTIDVPNRTLKVQHHVVDGLDSNEVHRLILGGTPYTTTEVRRFIEDYRPRKHLSVDQRMVTGVLEILSRLKGSELINNTGSRKVVKPALLAVLGLTGFPTTHHQDLEAAARILVFGMLKDERLNLLLTTIIEDHLENKSWAIVP